MTEIQPTRPELTEAEEQVIETIGGLIQFWSFSKHHGRIWALLYLRQEPLASPDIQNLLEMSAGLVSMSLKELQHWDVVRKVWVKGDRKDYYTANTDLWAMITRVLREREFNLVLQSIENLDDALGELETTEPAEGTPTQAELDYMKPRVEQLTEVIRTFASFVDTLLNQAEANLEDLRTKMSLPD
jgi:DNA-binding transcriptional regulator GbsR (MarR family)